MKKGEPGVSMGDVARDTRRKATFLLKKPFVEQHEVYGLAKDFFKSYLKKPVEFTSAELKEELHKVYLSSNVRDRVDRLIEKLSLMEYTDSKYGQAELKLLIQDLDTIVRDLVIERKRHIPFLTRVANFLWHKKPKKTETVITEFPVVEPNDATTIEMNTVLEDLYTALSKGKVKLATKYYKVLMKRYNTLGSTMQHEFYHKVNEAYDAIRKQQG